MLTRSFPGEDLLTASLQETQRLPKYSVEHRFREQAGLGVPLARMIRGNQFDRRQGEGHPMPERRLWDRHIVTNGQPGAEESVHGDRPERDDYAQGGEFFFSSRRRHTRSVSAFLLNRSSDLFLKASHSFRNRLLVICKNAYLFATMIMTSVSSPFSCCSGIVRLNLM